MEKVLISQLTGTDLNNAVAKVIAENFPNYIHEGGNFEPSTNWLQAGQIIEMARISIEANDLIPCRKEENWCAFLRENLFTKAYQYEFQQGETPLVAAMRCFIASKHGHYYELPDLETVSVSKSACKYGDTACP